MTTLRANHDLWHSYSISPIEPGAKNERLTLLEFLAENEGKRCVVVLDVRVSFALQTLTADIDTTPRKLRRFKIQMLYGPCLFLGS